MPKAADGLSEVPKAAPGNASARFSRNRGIINGRTVMAPLAAFTMAGLLFVYARTSIRAAKLNAQKHREADGGQISWHKESLRRHGQIERLDDDRGTFGEALLGDMRRKKQRKAEENQKVSAERSENDAELRKIIGKKD
ncbi:hypothetical protein COCVIDRAFT_31836 [Bipolaris victoriae FI3]|uniref:Uncharacterized protein n=2 Tax=Bipolaris TaxID=33194 RepID=W6XRW1_COCC2|nr:uncharacterized protein COCCADRAFT_9259 [Bipolaris zeicola 26-R-13]XP_014550426.1 hypothetical protein COCVIDRAFT_31836 [Bipolaris victoriae FI3]EUC28368.1 hypothetical protein COCCADRAFT_9259 [Bipolaris zeicola 26-R-13]